MIKRLSMPWTRSEGLLMGYVFVYRYQVYIERLSTRKRNPWLVLVWSKKCSSREALGR